MDKKGNRKTTKKFSTLRYVFVFIAIIMIVVGIKLIYLGLDTKDRKDIYYSYASKRNTDYQVYLRDNSFYDSTIMSAGKQYPSILIDKFNVNFIYNYRGSEKSDINYSYNVVATLIGEYKDSSNQDGLEVWNREFVLIDNKSFSKKNSSTFSIVQNFDLNYQAYNNLVSSYRKSYDLNIDAYLKVVMTINYKIDLYNGLNKDVRNVEYIEIDIPLNNTVSKVIDNYEPSVSKNLANVQKAGVKFNYLIVGIVLILISVVIIVSNRSTEKETKETLYKKNINKILKEYGDLIVTVTNKPDINNLKKMNLAILDDLIDVAEQNRCNIIHYVSSANKQSILMVISDRYVYIYKVTSDEVK